MPGDLRGAGRRLAFVLWVAFATALCATGHGRLARRRVLAVRAIRSQSRGLAGARRGSMRRHACLFGGRLRAAQQVSEGRLLVRLAGCFVPTAVSPMFPKQTLSYGAGSSCLDSPEAPQEAPRDLPLNPRPLFRLLAFVLVRLRAAVSCLHIQPHLQEHCDRKGWKYSPKP